MQLTTTLITALALASNAMAAPAAANPETAQSLDKRQPLNLFFYEDANFSGQRTIWGYSTPEGDCLDMQGNPEDDADLRGLVSSFKITFAECTFFDGDGCRGNSKVASNTHVAYVGSWAGEDWNDRIRSAWCRSL